MNNFLDWFTSWFIGSLGRGVLDLIHNNFSVFLTLVVMYGLLLLHAKLIYSFFLPKKLDTLAKTIIKKHPFVSEKKLYHQIIHAWEEELSLLPFYYVVPSKNELWIKRPNKQYRETQLLFFTNKEKAGNYDSHLIRKLISQESKC